MSTVSTTASRSSVYASRLAPWQWAMAIALLLALFSQATRAALRNSVTFDEGQHIARGYAYLKTGDLRFQRFQSAHPPGMAILEAAPLLLIPNMPEPSTLRGWGELDTVLFAKQLVLKSPIIEKLLFAARVPVMLVTLLLAAFVFRWASELRGIGPMAGLITLGLCAFDPNIIANGMLATTDLGVTAFSFISLYWLYKTLQRPSPGRLLLTGVTMGMALMSKMTAIVLLPVSALAMLVLGLAAHRASYFDRLPIVERWTARVCNLTLKRLLGLAVMGAAIYALAFLVIWSIYRFEIGRLPGVPIPIPAATHFSSAIKAQQHLDVGHPAFLMGQLSEKGWWYYFPVAFVIKTPVPMLILLAVSAALALRSARGGKFRAALRLSSRQWQASLPLVTFVGAYSIVALLSAVNIGYRHLLPLLPCLFVLAGQVSSFNPPTKWGTASQISSKSRITHYALRFTFYVLFLWYVVGTASIFPNYLTYFNELVGGPKNGYKYLVDSNLDWGQSLIELRSYIAQHHLGSINLSATGYVNPVVYGIAYNPLPPMQNPQPVVHFDPKPGQYYIGAQNLQIGSPVDHDVFGWFRERTPSAWVANAVLVYDVPSRPAGQWVAQCAAPLAPLEPEAVAEGFGRDDLRQIEFDCRTSWVYPATAPGWYIVGDDAGPATLPKQLALEFRTKGLSQGARFTVYRRDAGPDLDGLSTQFNAAASDTLTQGPTLHAPVDVGPLTFLGFILDRTEAKPGQTATLTTYWRVENGPGRLISIMAHLAAADGQTIANGDGLGVPIENWLAGDVIVQRHVLTIPRDAQPGTYQVQTGVYTLQDQQRFQVQNEGVVSGDRLVLGTVEVKP